MLARWPAGWTGRDLQADELGNIANAFPNRTLIKACIPEVCNFLVVSDELWRDWRPAFGLPELRDALKRAEEVVLEAIATLRK